MSESLADFVQKFGGFYLPHIQSSLQILPTPPPLLGIPQPPLLQQKQLLLVQSALWVGSTMSFWAVSSLHLRLADSVGLKLSNIVKNRFILDVIMSFFLKDGFLAKPKTEEQLNFLTSLAYVEEAVTGVQGWWVGLADISHEGNWTVLHWHGLQRFTFWAVEGFGLQL